MRDTRDMMGVPLEEGDKVLKFYSSSGSIGKQKMYVVGWTPKMVKLSHDPESKGNACSQGNTLKYEWKGKAGY